VREGDACAVGIPAAGWYSGQNGAHYCGSACIPKLPDGRLHLRPHYVRMSVQDVAIADDLDRWAAWARGKFFEIMSSPKDDQEAPESRQQAQMLRLRERAARMERDAERLRSGAARLKREADLIERPVPPAPAAPSESPRRGETRKR